MSSNFLNDFFWTRNVNCQSTKSLREECSNDFIVLNHTFSRHATRVYHSILTKVTNIKNRFFFSNIEGLIFQKSFPLKIWKTFQTCKKTKNIRIFIQPSSHPPVHPIEPRSNLSAIVRKCAMFASSHSDHYNPARFKCNQSNLWSGPDESACNVLIHHISLSKDEYV